jgi:25S rRNA (uracil2634-N3)-methyltransferase
LASWLHGHPLKYILGKGITDQDRNILANQMIILGFLRSCTPFLAVGPIPSVTQTLKRKQTSEDDDDAMEDHEEKDGNLGTSERGTVLITLRNVVPYTQW